MFPSSDPKRIFLVLTIAGNLQVMVPTTADDPYDLLTAAILLDYDKKWPGSPLPVALLNARALEDLGLIAKNGMAITAHNFLMHTFDMNLADAMNLVKYAASIKIEQQFV